ncbi:MAG: hypothetical protein M1353_01940 [Nitrospirae bacterium]|nr:hypothetical protein [Nitrospirota bacterium]
MSVRTEISKYILKEYGSWGVLVISFLTGFLAGFPAAKTSWEWGGLKSMLALIALSLFVNSKQAFTWWLRRADSKGAGIFMVQVFLASLLLLAVFGNTVLRLLPYVPVPVVYILLLKSAGEHAITTEIAGFATLTLSALIAHCAVSGEVDSRLYIAAAVFFTAGVFKVKVYLRKRALERISMVLYVFFAFAIYYAIKVPAVVLFPLVDNIIFSLTLYNIKLRAAGWIEVLKGIAFLVLLKLNYG